MKTFSETVSYNTGPIEMDNSSNLIDVQSSTSNLASQKGIIFLNKATDNFDYYATPDQQETSEQDVMSNINSADQNSNVQQMTLCYDQSGIQLTLNTSLLFLKYFTT